MQSKKNDILPTWEFKLENSRFLISNDEGQKKVFFYVLKEQNYQQNPIHSENTLWA